MDKQRGTVKWFSREKGWGFIQLESGEDIFVHHSDIIGEGFVTLEDDEPVEFSVEEMEKGPRAREVRSLGDGGEASPTAVESTGERSRRQARDDQRAAGRDEAGRDDGDEKAGAGESVEGPGGLRPLAEQLREKLGRHFPGLGG